jgi:FlaA1/EpsC-like NDP-sugar epimerase
MAIGLDVAPGADTHVVGSVAERAVVERVLSNHRIEAVVHAGALHKPDIARYPGRAFITAVVTIAAPVFSSLLSAKT